MEENAPYNEIEYRATVKVLFDFYDLKAEAIEEFNFVVTLSGSLNYSELEELAKYKFLDNNSEMFKYESNIDVFVLDVKRN